MAPKKIATQCGDGGVELIHDAEGLGVGSFFEARSSCSTAGESRPELEGRDQGRNLEIPKIVNIQDVGGQAKPCQVRQFLRLVERYELRMEN